MLSQITTHLSPEAIQFHPGWSNLRCHPEAEGDDLLWLRVTTK